MENNQPSSKVLELITAAEHAMEIKQWQIAVTHYEQVRQTQGQDTAAVVCAELARAYRSMRRYAEARTVLLEVYKRQPRNSLILRQLGEVELADHHYELAARYWQELLNKKKGEAYAKVYSRLAYALRKCGQLAKAAQAARDGLARFPDDVALRNEIETVQHMQVPLPAVPDAWATAGPKKHPYHDLPPRQFWNRAVSSKNALEINDWYRKKFSIAGLAVAAAGICFAQHLGRQLRINGFDYVDTEPAPGFLKPESHLDFGYSMYSSRFGNIYTSRQLLQLLQRALGQFQPKDVYWEKDGGFVDPFRPTIEPEPFATVEELLKSRCSHLAAVLEMFRRADLFVFTMGLTEAWVSNEDGAVYPVAPGVSGGRYDPSRYSLKNLSYADVFADMEQFVALVRGINKNLKFILTVSPVPLMATATDSNVIVATTYSKAVLRTVAGHLSTHYDFIDYFPSFEIISSHVMRGQFFNPDMRTVSIHGVEHVMKQFFAEHTPLSHLKPTGAKAKRSNPDEVACDEELLRKFGEGR